MTPARWLRALRTTRPPSAARTRRPVRRLTVEPLEDRTVPAAGALDPTFGTGGLVTTNIGQVPSNIDTRAVAVRPDGKIVAASRDFVVARYNPDGTPDTSFGTGGTADATFGLPESFNYEFGGEDCFGLAVGAGGKIVLIGSVKVDGVGADFAVVRLNADGSLDTSFNGTGRKTIDFGSPFDSGLGVAVQADGRIVLTGSSARTVTIDGFSYHSETFVVARLKVNGNLDGTFNGTGTTTIGFGPYSGYAAGSSVAVDSAGRIVVVGQSNQSGTAGFAVARLNPNGSPDTSFSGTGTTTIGFGPASSSAGYGVTLQSNGKIVVAGWSSRYQSNTGSWSDDFGVVRLNVNGSLDTTFNGTGKKTIDFGGSYFGYGVQDAGSGVAVQADGKVVVAGYSFQGRNRADFALARLQADPPLLADSPTFAATSRPPSPASRSPSRPASPACRPSPRR